MGWQQLLNFCVSVVNATTPNCKSPSLSPMKAQHTCLLLLLKFQSAREASHHPAFMSNCGTISHTFYSLIYPVDEGNQIAWGQSKNLEFERLKLGTKNV